MRLNSQRSMHAEIGRGCLLVYGLVLCWCSLAAADEISLVQGTTIKQAIGGKIRGQIQSESSAEVVVQVGGSSISVPIDQITSIKYDGQPASIQLAEIRESAGQLTEAAELYRKAAADAAGKPLILESVLFLEAQVLVELSLLDPKHIPEATEKLQSFVRSHPTSRHSGPARSALVRLFIAKEDFTSAMREVAELAKLPGATDRAAILKTRVLAKQGKHQDAVAELDRLIDKFPKNSTEQRNTQLAKAESLAALKQFVEAERLVREVIGANPAENAAVQAPAYNTLGDCMREANRPKDALIAYLHTDLLYAKNKEEHPRALYQISQLFRELKQDDRADETFKRLKQDYPRSVWLTLGNRDHP